MQDKGESLSKGQREYEARRAAKAGMTLEQWMSHKAKQRALAATEPAAVAKAAARPGLMSRLLGRLGVKG